MSGQSEHPEDSIFAAALARGDPQQRAVYLAEACGDDQSLRERIEDLLRHHAQADRFLESPPPAFAPTLVEPPLREAPGTTIGPYKLLEQIGEGGFGVVFVAEQCAPVKRKVALKVIKPGMDTRQVIARFEAERQALALMDHPHIAKVLDGGTTETGRPYFVMELVKGAPITEYCDAHQLAPRERLELFLAVCHAVQHAHQKGIIHRDIKPSNVLVSVHDDQPVVKVIDFGVAKAISGPLTDKTLHTGYSQMIGTPLYMSPEQAALSGVDVDTRTDIYSLGVLLYELLTGTTPFDRTRLKAAAFDEIRRIIREEEPQKPSTRLSELSRSGLSGRTVGSSAGANSTGPTRQAGPASLASIAALRKTEPRKLSQLVRGDLDWIVMKALEKDRTRRYETANGFALDLLRYLHDEPVLACPPSASYRFGKFARRNKAALATAAMVALTLVAGIIGTSWQAIRATHEADRANKAEGLAQQRYVNERAARVQADAARAAEAQQRGIAQQETARAAAALVEVQEQKQQAEANFVKARRAVDEYLTQVTESELLSVPGLQPLREDLLEAALRFYAEFTQERAHDLSLQREMAFAHYRLGLIYSDLGHAQESSAAIEQSIRLFEQLRDREPQDRNLQLGLGRAYSAAKRHDDTIALCDELLAGDEGDVEARTLLAGAYNELATGARSTDVEAALKHHQQAFALREALAREFPDDPRRLAELGGTMNNLALLLSGQGKDLEALAMLERALDYVGQAHERAPHSLLWGEWLWRVLRNVAVRQDALQQQEHALATWQRLVAVSRKRAFENPAIAALRGKLYQAHTYLAKYQQQMGNAREAARSFRDARDVLQNLPRETPAQIYELATVYAVLAQPADETSPTSPEDADEQQRHADLALATLREAIDAGFVNSPAVQSERAFDPLREREDFKSLLSSLQTAAEIQRLAGSKAGDAEQNLADRQRAAELLKGLEPGSPRSLSQRATLAATLQSMGEIQTGLKQFADAQKSLQEAIALWRELAEAQPEKLQWQTDRIGAQISLGALYRDSDRGPEAHQVWQACLEQLDQLRVQNPGNTQLEVQVADKEYLIAWIYGRLGAFSLAANYARRNLELERVANPVLDLDAGIVLAMFDGDDALRAVCRLIDRKRANQGGTNWLPGQLRNLGKVSSLPNPPALPPEQSLEWIEPLARTDPGLWHLYLLALAQHRAGKSAEGLATFERITGAGDYEALSDSSNLKLGIAFAGALIAQGAGRPELARERLDKAEAFFVDYCRQCLQQPTVGLAPPLNVDGHWWEFTAPVLLRREAWRVIADRATPDEAWLRLIEARASHLLGDTARRDEQLAAADSSDAAVWQTRLKLSEEMDPTGQLAESAWQRLVDLAGNDPLPWIRRGRWYAARGEHQKADADFAKAASLTPNELNRFLEAGWWVIGPYPADLDEFCPPELDPDPSRPVRTSDPQTGLSDEPVRWRHVDALSPKGYVKLNGLFGPADNRSVFALTYVCSPDERTATLWLDDDDRVWVNGERLEKPTRPGAWHWGAAHRFPCLLRAGRNCILIRKGPGELIGARLGDNPYDRGWEFYRFGLFAEAAASLAEVQRREVPEIQTAETADVDRFHAVAQLVEGNFDDYRRSTNRLVERYGGSTHFHHLANVVSAAGVGPDGLDADRLAIVLDAWKSQHPFETQPWQVVPTALIDYRLGHYADVIQSLASLHDDPAACVVLAMAHFRQGNTAEAGEWLERARGPVEAMFDNPDRPTVDYIEWPSVIYREACRLIKGDSSEIDALYARFRDVRRRMWQEREPALADYIDAVRAASDQPQVYLARGRRLAELGRIDEAAADFNKALELAPDDLDALLARARFHASHAHLELAEVDLAAASATAHAAPEPQNYALVRRVENELGRHEAVLAHWLGRSDRSADHAWLRRVKAQRQIQLGNWQAAAEILEQHEHWLHDILLGPLYCLLDNKVGLRRIYEAQLARFPVERDEATRDYYRIDTLSLSPATGDQTAELTHLVDSHLEDYPNWRRAPLGAGLYRLGRYDEALRVLSEYLGSNQQAPLQVDASVWPLLAMTHWQLGQHDEARSWLSRSANWIDLTRRAASLPQPVGRQDADCFHWLHANAFFVEARALIGSDSLQPNSDQDNDGNPEKN